MEFLRFEQVRDRVPDNFEDLGGQQVKNIARSPMHAVKKADAIATTSPLA